MLRTQHQTKRNTPRADQEQKTLVGSTSLLTKNPPMPPKLNRQQDLLVLTKIDEILAWQQQRADQLDESRIEDKVLIGFVLQKLYFARSLAPP